MTTTFILVCSKCGNLQLAKANQKTKACTYCNHVINIEKSKKIASASDAYKASEILRKLKAEAQNKNFRHL